MKLTETPNLSDIQAHNLALLTDEWQSIHALADKHPRGRAGVSGIARAFSGLMKAGMADWRVINSLSSYRLTPAGREYLATKDTNHER